MLWFSSIARRDEMVSTAGIATCHVSSASHLPSEPFQVSTAI